MAYFECVPLPQPIADDDWTFFWEYDKDNPSIPEIFTNAQVVNYLDDALEIRASRSSYLCSDYGGYFLEVEMAFNSTANNPQIELLTKYRTGFKCYINNSFDSLSYQNADGVLSVAVNNLNNFHNFTLEVNDEGLGTFKIDGNVVFENKAPRNTSYFTGNIIEGCQYTAARYRSIKYKSKNEV